MSDVDIPVKYFGVIYFIWLVTSAVSANYAHSISNKIGQTASIVLLPILVSIPLIVVGSISTKLVILLIIFMKFVYGFTCPILTDEINKLVKSHNRATMLSLKGFVQNISFVIISPILGHWADLLSVQAVYLIEGLILLPFGVFIALKLKK